MDTHIFSYTNFLNIVLSSTNNTELFANDFFESSVSRVVTEINAMRECAIRLQIMKLF